VCVHLSWRSGWGRRLCRAVTAALVGALMPVCGWTLDPERSLAQLHHTTWTAREGAPTYVQMIAQTDDGFLWFATRNGLLRFDGVQFERYLPSSGDAWPSGSVRSLLAMPANGLLIGWSFGGATLLRDGHVTNYSAQQGYPPGTTYQFMADSAGQVWAATSSVLARFDGQRWQRVGADWNFADQRAIALFVDREGTLGAFTDSTLMTLAKGAKSFQPTGGKNTSRVPIVRTPDGALYLSDARGIRPISSLATYDRMDGPWVVKAAPQRETTRIVADRDGSLWVGGQRGVGRIVHPERPTASIEHFSDADGLSDSQVHFVFEDREGSIWVSTDSGIDRFRAGPFVPPAGLLKVDFPAVLPDADGGVWFAGRGLTLRHMNRRGAVRELDHIIGTCAYRDPEGVAWYGSQHPISGAVELLRDDKGRLSRVPLPEGSGPGVDVQAIATDANRTPWVSLARKGVFRLQGKAWSHPPDLPEAGKVPAVVMTRDGGGRLWLGYLGNRLARWDGATTRIFSSTDGLEVGNILTIREKGRHLWIAGEKGLALLVGERFQSMAVAAPDVLRGITGLVETSEGDLWIHAIAGAIRIPAVEVRKAIDVPGRAMSFRLFDDEDGLTGVPTDIRPLPTLVEGSDGRLWFATSRGLVTLDPRRIVANDRPPMVVAKAVYAGGVRHAALSGLTLSARHANLQIDYTATSLTAARRVRFRYMLEGVDPGWQDAGARRQAFYTNLAPGPYRFTVMAANEDGVWSTTGAAVEFEIAPAWYQTRLFLVLAVLCVVAMLVLLYRMRVSRVRAQIQGRLQERLLERERIARELHDTLLQGFQGLVLTFEAATRRIPAGQASREAMEKALVRADEVLAEGRDRVRDLRDALSLQGELSKALNETAEDLALVHAATFGLTVKGRPRPLHPVVLEEAYLIVREALTNAFRHAAARRIEIEVVYGMRRLSIHVRDDGVGIDTEVLAKGGVPGHWGLPGMQERATKLGARLLLRTGRSAGSGTDVGLDVPAVIAYSDRTALSRCWWTLMSRHDRTGAKHEH
jgi:signal transduction histidine kinase/ligand-binding sensor domain-containing protein